MFSINHHHIDNFQKTASIFRNDDVLPNFDMEILKVNQCDEIQYNSVLRLGKQKELIFEWFLEKSKRYQVLVKNTIVYEHKRTIGELDFIVYDQKQKQYVHVELTFKFYLFDDHKDGELAPWIGPNRNDSLLQKITKLKEKQFPLLYHSQNNILQEHSITKITQQVCFKAQLFLPFHKKEVLLSDTINPNAVMGYWYYQSDFIEAFQDKKGLYLLPEKKEWGLLRMPLENEQWLSFDEIVDALFEIHQNQKSPLCWFVTESGEVDCFFVVSWESIVPTTPMLDSND